tara:strand:- start:3935 stop:5050 length:1116 start_codon:yes stop_codon:yes gene_type:complete
MQLRKVLQIEPWIDKKESIYIKKVVNKTFLTEGNETKKFEERFTKKFKSKHAVAVSNWTNGIYLTLKALNILPGDEVIVPNLTFIATVNAVIMAGAKPVICEVDEKNLSMNLDHYKKIISKKTKVVIPVHLYGHCCDLDKLKKISKKHNVEIIEDAAQAVGAKYGNNYLGTIGKMGGYSFYGNKIITTGEGGIILTNSKILKKKLYRLKNHGRDIKGIFKHKYIGYNFMFTEMQAAIGNVQLSKLDKILKKKKEIYFEYKKELEKIKEIKFMEKNLKNKPVYWFSNIFLKKKNKLKKFLNKKKIQTRDIFYPIHRQPCYLKNKMIIRKKSNYSISDKIYSTGLSLPSSYSLTSKEQKFVIDTIKDFFNNKN